MLSQYAGVKERPKINVRPDGSTSATDGGGEICPALDLRELGLTGLEAFRGLV